jgi:coenzyme F420-reducing hydrogenase alpha subunit
MGKTLTPEERAAVVARLREMQETAKRQRQAVEQVSREIEELEALMNATATDTAAPAERAEEIPAR